MRVILFAFVCVWLGSATAAVDSKSLRIQLPVEKYKLANGLTVLLLEDHSVPMISYHTWYKVGSRDEKEGITGSAHMLEHMMFQGAKKYTGKQFHKIMDENGVEWNAFTTYDYTGFYMNLPSSKLELVMDVEFDRMSSLAISAEQLKSEREVVKEERRMRVDNNPPGVLGELAMSTVFKKSHYRWPVIGFMKDIEAYTPETLRAFYETYYVPSNAILVIAGDFKTDQAKRLVEKYYGSLPAKTVPERNYPREPRQEVQYNARVRKDVQATSFRVVFQGPAVGAPESYVLDLAGVILGAGSSSRLYKRLVTQKQTAAGVGGGLTTMADGGLFSVGVSLKPGVPMAESLEAVYNEIYRLRNKTVTEDELRKAKTIVMKGAVDGLTTLDGKARALATSEIENGDYRALFTDLEKYEAVTAEDINRVADAWMNQSQRSIVVLDPKNAVTMPAAPASASASTPKTPLATTPEGSAQ